MVNTAFELAALGVPHGSPSYRGLRQAAMGTPVTRTLPPATNSKDLPKDVQRLLSKIRKHPSKASSSYYHNSYAQYFDDASSSLRETMRVLKPGGLAVLIVQSSYYKEVCVDLPQLYLSLASQHGLSGAIAGEMKIRRALAQINPHAAKYNRRPSYKEAVLLLEKGTR
ncbi:MAG: hypothetical protein R3C68_10045 [Myxococcota bacterium]